MARTAASSALETMKSEIEVPLRPAAYSIRRFCSGFSRASTRSIFLSCFCGVFSATVIAPSNEWCTVVYRTLQYARDRGWTLACLRSAGRRRYADADESSEPSVNHANLLLVT